MAAAGQTRWGQVAIGDIRPSQVQAWLSGLTKIAKKADATPEPLGATGVIYAHQVLSAILGDAVRDRMLAANPCDGMDLPARGRSGRCT